MTDFNDRSVSEQRTRVARAFRGIEQTLYMVVALALGLSGAALFGYTIARFVADLGQVAFIKSLLGLLDGLLLVFIITELLHTVRAVIAENVLMTEPFLIVGIVAAIRRFIVISAEAQETVGRQRFDNLMLEMGLLVAAVLSLGLTIFLLRHTRTSEPRPAHEPDTGQAAEGTGDQRSTRRATSGQ